MQYELPLGFDPKDIKITIIMHDTKNDKKIQSECFLNMVDDVQKFHDVNIFDILIAKQLQELIKEDTE